MIATYIACAVLSAFFGYAIGARWGSPTESLSIIGRLCSVIEKQSGAMRAAQRQSLDAAVMSTEDQLERAANERLADLQGGLGSAMPANSSKDYITGNRTDSSRDGDRYEDISTELS